MKDFIFALRAYPNAVFFTNKHRLWAYYMVPALINLVLFGSLGYAFWLLGANLAAKLETFVPNEAITGKWLLALHYALQTLIYLVLFIFYMKLYRFLMLLLLSPALALYSEKVQEIYHQKTSRAFSWVQLQKDVLRGLQLTFSNLFVELSLTFALLLLGLVLSFLSPLTSALIILVEAYFLGFSMIDYRNEFLQLSPQESKTLVWHYRFFAIGIGISFMLILWIPIIGALVAPFLAITAAGVGINELEKE
jgi:CysZ protein